MISPCAIFAKANIQIAVTAAITRKRSLVIIVQSELLLYGSDLRGDGAVREAAKLLNQGKVIALKGVGGYNFVATPFDGETVQNLRKLKGREEKTLCRHVSFHRGSGTIL